MVNKLNYYWRLFATALGYFLFGVGGILLCLTVFPVAIVLNRDKHLRSLRVRRYIRYTFRIFLCIFQFLGVIRVTSKDTQELKALKGKIVICNHPTLLDVVVIMSRARNLQCIVNFKLWSNPFVGGIVRAAGYIRNDLDPELFVQRCKDMLASGENILIFPEGTRTVPGKPLSFQRGFANLALFAQADIQALQLSCRPIHLTKGAKWYDIPSKRAEYVLQMGPSFSWKGDEADQPRSIRVRHIMRDVQHFYKDRL